MSTIRALIVDDEPLARRRLRDLLARHEGVEVVGEATHGEGAVAEIRDLDPDLVFLDIQMPHKSGFDVVREIGPDAMPLTIFVTAYDQHALQAFEVAAVDYLVKPYDDERFDQALARARRMLQLEEAGDIARRLRAVLEGGGAPAGGARRASPYVERIAVESRGRVTVVPVERIDYITAEGAYAVLHADGDRYSVRERMQTLEERLDPAVFFRIHRSSIVRIDRIEVLLKGAGGDYDVRLRDGTDLSVSRGRVQDLQRRIGLSR